MQTTLLITSEIKIMSNTILLKIQKDYDSIIMTRNIKSLIKNIEFNIMTIVEGDFSDDVIMNMLEKIDIFNTLDVVITKPILIKSSSCRIMRFFSKDSLKITENESVIDGYNKDEVISIELDKPNDVLKIYQIYFNDSQLSSIDAIATPYFNAELTPYFENAVILKLLNDDAHRNCKYFGVLSYKFSTKVRDYMGYSKRTNVKKPYLLSKEVIDKYYNAGYSLVCYLKTGIPISVHQSVYQTLQLILKLINKDHVVLTELKNSPIYCNYYIATPKLWDMYLNEYLIPTKKIMEENEEVKKLIWTDSKYAGNIPKDVLIEKFGVPYYPQHTFIFERLINYFLSEHTEFKYILSEDVRN